MPFKSTAQRGYLFANHPEIAQEFAAATPKGKKLPRHVKKQAVAPAAPPTPGWDPNLAILKPLPGQAPAQPAQQPVANIPARSGPTVRPPVAPPTTAPPLKLAAALQQFEQQWGAHPLVHPGQTAPAAQVQGAQADLAALQQAGQQPAFPAPQPPVAPAAGAPIHPELARTPGFHNPMPGAPNPLGAGSLAYGGMRAPGVGTAHQWKAGSSPVVAVLESGLPKIARTGATTPGGVVAAHANTRDARCKAGAAPVVDLLHAAAQTETPTTTGPFVPPTEQRSPTLINSPVDAPQPAAPSAPGVQKAADAIARDDIDRATGLLRPLSYREADKILAAQDRSRDPYPSPFSIAKQVERDVVKGNSAAERDAARVASAVASGADAPANWAQRNWGPLALGAGAAGLGAYGLYHFLHRNDKEKRADEFGGDDYGNALPAQATSGMRVRPPHLHREESLARQPRQPHLMRREALGRLPRMPRVSWTGVGEVQSGKETVKEGADLNTMMLGQAGQGAMAAGRYVGDSLQRAGTGIRGGLTAGLGYPLATGASAFSDMAAQHGYPQTATVARGLSDSAYANADAGASALGATGTPGAPDHLGAQSARNVAAFLPDEPLQRGAYKVNDATTEFTTQALPLAGVTAGVGMAGRAALAGRSIPQASGALGTAQRLGAGQLNWPTAPVTGPVNAVKQVANAGLSKSQLAYDAYKGLTAAPTAPRPTGAPPLTMNAPRPAAPAAPAAPRLAGGAPKAPGLGKQGAVSANRLKTAGGLGGLIGRLGRKVAPTAFGAMGGAALGAGEIATGYADPNMSDQGKGAVIAANALMGGLAGNRGMRRKLFFNRTATPLPGGQGLAARYKTTLQPRIGRIAGAGLVTAGIPKYVNLGDAGARLGNLAQTTWKEHPENLAPLTDPAGFAEKQLNDPHGAIAHRLDDLQQRGIAAVNDPQGTVQTTIRDTANNAAAAAQADLKSPDGVVRSSVRDFGKSPAAQAFTGQLGRGVAGLAGGGLAGWAAGAGLGRAVAPDDETLSYEDRRRREQWRGALEFGGTTLGSVGGSLLLNRLAAKTAGAASVNCKSTRLDAGASSLIQDDGARPAAAGPVSANRPKTAEVFPNVAGMFQDAGNQLAGGARTLVSNLATNARRLAPGAARLGSRLATGAGKLSPSVMAPLALGGAETISDTAGQAINNPDHPWSSAGRALVTGLGTTAGMTGGAYLGSKYSPWAGESGKAWGGVAGGALGAVGGGLGGAVLGRAIVPGAPAHREEEDEEKEAAARSLPNKRTFAGKEVKVVYGPQGQLNGRFHGMGRGATKRAYVLELGNAAYQGAIAPHGEKLRAAGRGVLTGFGTDVGGSVGTVLGGLGGAGAGAGVGGLGGAGVGALLAALQHKPIGAGAQGGAQLGAMLGGSAGGLGGAGYGLVKGLSAGNRITDRALTNMGVPYRLAHEKEEKRAQLSAADQHVQEAVERFKNQLPGLAAQMGVQGALTSSLVGAGLGGAEAPQGHGGEGALRGGVAGTGTALGALGGAGLGAYAGHELGGGSIPGMIAGGLGGAGLGALAGHFGSNALMGRPSWERDKEKHAAVRVPPPVAPLGKRVPATDSEPVALQAGWPQPPRRGAYAPESTAQLGGHTTLQRGDSFSALRGARPLK